MASNQSPGDINLSGGHSVVGEPTLNCSQGVSQPYAEACSCTLREGQSKLRIQLELGKCMRNSLEAVSHDRGIRNCPLVTSYQAYFLLLYEKLQDIPPRLVRWQSSLAYVTYVERCKVTKTLRQSHSTRTRLLPQIQTFYSQGLVNTCVGHCKPDLPLTSDEASLFIPSSVFCRSFSSVYCFLSWAVSLMH